MGAHSTLLPFFSVGDLEKAFFGFILDPGQSCGVQPASPSFDLMKSAFGFQRGFGTWLKIPGLHSTSSELVKKRNWGKISNYWASYPDKCVVLLGWELAPSHGL